MMPDIMDLEIKRGRTILDISTNSKWIGLTYQEDIDELKSYLNKIIKEGIYPNNLW